MKKDLKRADRELIDVEASCNDVATAQRKKFIQSVDKGGKTSFLADVALVATTVVVVALVVVLII